MKRRCLAVVQGSIWFNDVPKCIATLSHFQIAGRAFLLAGASGSEYRQMVLYNSNRFNINQAGDKRGDAYFKSRHSVFYLTKIVCFETENAPKYPSAPPDQLLLGFVGAGLPLPSTNKASVLK